MVSQTRNGAYGHCHVETEFVLSHGVKASSAVLCAGNPSTDILMLTSIGEEKLVFLYETMSGSDWFYKNGLKRQKEHYPHDAKLFTEFRDLVSWSNAHLIEGDPVDFESFENANPRPSDTLPDNTFFMEFVPASIVIGDVKDKAFPTGAKMPKYVKVLIDDANEHWAVQAKHITRVGSFVAPSWVTGLDGIEGPFGSCPDDEQQSEENNFGDEDGDEGSEDYSEDEEDDYFDTDREGEGSDEDFSDEE
ncbi:hypothetical protein ZTR_04277 [Talaromyces verruculosus]|nr:hypothetical protein ZTR_04277 [Talaromyces verruculosus]